MHTGGGNASLPVLYISAPEIPTIVMREQVETGEDEPPVEIDDSLLAAYLSAV